MNMRGIWRSRSAILGVFVEDSVSAGKTLISVGETIDRQSLRKRLG